MTIQTMASGSSGNMALIRTRHSTVALDLGIRSQKGTVEALLGAGVCVESLEAAIVSHSHTDHLGYSGLSVCRRAGVPVMAGAETTRKASRVLGRKGVNGDPDGWLVEICPETKYLVGDIEVTPFDVPHDVPTFGFVFEADGRKAVVATDLGCAPDELLPLFVGADLVVLEANYDEGMLRFSNRHPRDKARVAGDLGHLSNVQAGHFLKRMLDAGGRPPSAVMLVHLSGDHNSPEIAVEDVSNCMGPGLDDTPRVLAAPRHRSGPVMEV